MQPGRSSAPGHQGKGNSGGPAPAGIPAQQQTPQQQPPSGAPTDFALPTLPDYPPPSAVAPTPPLGRIPTGVPASASASTSSGAATATQSKPAASLNIAQRLGGTTATATVPQQRATGAPQSARSTPSATQSQPESVPPRTPTLTAKMRAVQPPDVARQAMSELTLLAHELDALPEKMEESGLARANGRRYFDATRMYLDLAQLAWVEVAGERLEQGGAEPEYRQRAIAVARRVTQLQNECVTAASSIDFALPRKTPALWRRRSSLAHEGLRIWQRRLTPSPDAREMGQGLFLLRGYLGLAGAGTFLLALLDLITSAAVMLTALLGLGAILLLAPALANGDPITAASYAIAALGICLVELLVLLLAVNGPVPLGLLLGAAICSPTLSTRNERSGSPALAMALRIWWILVGILSALALVGALITGGGLLSVHGALAQPESVIGWLALVGSVLALTLTPAMLVSLAALLLFGLPVLLVTLLRCAVELGGSRAWAPVARRYALEPTLSVLAPITSAVLVGAWLATSAVGWQNLILIQLTTDTFTLALTVRGVALFLALALPYLALLELPYRVGIRRWRRSWLHDLRSRRADVESHVRRLSITDPHTGAQDTSEENLRAMQYDLVLLQFYRDKIEEAERVPASPFKLPGIILTLAAAIIGAILIDSASLFHLFTLPH